MSDARDRESSSFWILDFIGDNLDPNKFIPLLSEFQAGKPIFKGLPIGRTVRPTAVGAKTSMYSIWTGDHVVSTSPDDHLKFLLDIITPHIALLEEIMAIDGLVWKATFIDVNTSRHLLPQIDQRLLARAAALKLPLRAERETPPPS